MSFPQSLAGATEISHVSLYATKIRPEKDNLRVKYKLAIIVSQDLLLKKNWQIIYF